MYTSDFRLQYFYVLGTLGAMKLFTDAYLNRIDPSRVFASVLAVPEQAAHAWKDSRKVRLPASFKKAHHIAICGMGGSLLGPHMLTRTYEDRLRVPITLVNGYTLPKSVDAKTLVVLSSYSGTTEETLTCAREAKKVTRMRIGISLGGKLLAMLRRFNRPVYQIVETYNPSHQPRVGIGYSIFGQLGLLRSYFGVTDAEVKRAIRHAENIRHSWNATATGIANTKKLFRFFKDRMPVIIASEFLEGNAHVFSNQMNESAKSFSRFHIIPELNHHLLEGLDHPKAVVRKSAFLFIESPLYGSRNQKRIRLTKKIARVQGARVESLKIQGKDKLSAALELLFISGYFTTAFAIHQGIDPAEIQWVNYFKKHLAK